MDAYIEKLEGVHDFKKMEELLVFLKD